MICSLVPQRGLLTWLIISQSNSFHRRVVNASRYSTIPFTSEHVMENYSYCFSKPEPIMPRGASLPNSQGIFFPVCVKTKHFFLQVFSRLFLKFWNFFQDKSWCKRNGKKKSTKIKGKQKIKYSLPFWIKLFPTIPHTVQSILFNFSPYYSTFFHFSNFSPYIIQLYPW